jgi:hypothetical protein
MTYREETHSVECYANAIKCALENLRDEHITKSGDDFRTAFNMEVRNNGTLVTWADMYQNPEQVGHADMICTCEVKAQYAVEHPELDVDLTAEQHTMWHQMYTKVRDEAAETEHHESESLGSCGCTDYHMADCPTRTGYSDSYYDDLERGPYDL